VVLGPRSVVQLDQLVREAGAARPTSGRKQLSALAARLRDAGIDA
jgi:hypothetical protein